MIYFDNAATSWPKPPEVAQTMTAFLEQVGANPGRSGHRLSIDSARVVFQAREAVCELFQAPDPMRVVSERTSPKRSTWLYTAACAREIM